MLIFAIVLLLTKSLMVASIVICCANFILTFPLDFRNCRLHFSQEKFSPKLHDDRKNVYSILKNSFPLFLNGFLITYIYNEPKIDIDYLLTNGYFSSGVQRDFNILFMPILVLVLINARSKRQQLLHKEIPLRMEGDFCVFKTRGVFHKDKY